MKSKGAFVSETDTPVKVSIFSGICEHEKRILKETFGILARGFGQRRPTTPIPTGERQPFNLCVVNCSLQ